MRKLILSSFFIFALCILFAPRLPFIDYPDWIYQGAIFHGIISSDPLFLNAFRFVGPDVPNSLVTVFIGLLSFIVRPDLAGRFLVLFSAMIMFLGLRGLFGNKNNLFADSMALIFMPVVFLFMGLLSFYLGLGTFFLFVSRLNPSSRRWATILKYTISLIILYYIHFLAFFLFSVWLLINFLVPAAKNTPRLLELIPGYLFTGTLTLLYMYSASSSPSGSTIWSYHPLSKITGVFKALSIFYEFNDSSSLPILLTIIALNLLWVVLFLVGLIFWIKRNYSGIRNDPKFIFGIGCLVIGLATPLLINGFGYNSELRFYWVGFMFITAAVLAISINIPKKVIYLIAFFALFSIVWRSGQIMVKGFEDYKYEETLSTLIPDAESFQLVMIPYYLPEYYPFRSGLQKKIAALCQQITDINRVPLYLYLDRHQVYRDIFKTGIFRCNYPSCNIKALLKGTESSPGDDCSKLLFICSRGFTSSFREILAKRFSIIKEGSYFILASTTGSQ